MIIFLKCRKDHITPWSSPLAIFVQNLMGSAGLGEVWALLSLYLPVLLKAPCWHLRTRCTRLGPPSTFALAMPFRCQKRPILCPCGSRPLHLNRFLGTTLSLSGIPINHELHEVRTVSSLSMLSQQPAHGGRMREKEGGNRNAIGQVRECKEGMGQT